ncbi:MAG: hypothetical protein KKF46_05150 [Nanoarchaeota archaeon]|nr:hypothetical protein [Nanoarchaeota archaeon]MBU1321721.1 hypothetical protein [Nanoarchaeota archaeon]MBU1597687.1 hypothetical protein [Nanoarchaeota archaeon]MBU2440751.1 hypothetical protein [Nanoarchaeota archaeon]
MKEKIIMLSVFMLFGIFLLKGGITGFAISEECDTMMCDSDVYQQEATIENPAFLSAEDSNALSVVGVLLFAVSLVMMFGCGFVKARENKKENL